MRVSGKAGTLEESLGLSEQKASRSKGRKRSVTQTGKAGGVKA